MVDSRLLPPGRRGVGSPALRGGYPARSGLCSFPAGPGLFSSVPCLFHPALHKFCLCSLCPGLCLSGGFPGTSVTERSAGRGAGAGCPGPTGRGVASGTVLTARLRHCTLGACSFLLHRRRALAPGGSQALGARSLWEWVPGLSCPPRATPRPFSAQGSFCARCRPLGSCGRSLWLMLGEGARGGRVALLWWSSCHPAPLLPAGPGCLPPATVDQGSESRCACRPRLS